MTAVSTRAFTHTACQRLWTMAAGAVYAAGLVGAFWNLPLPDVASLALAGSMAGASCALVLWAIGAVRPVRITQFGIGSGVVVVANIGFLSFWGARGLVLIIAVHVLAPSALRVLPNGWSWAVRGLLHRPCAPEPGKAVSGVSPGPLTPASTLEVPDHLSDEDLCLAWQSSLRALATCRTVEQLLTVVEGREACLDELERRDPLAVQAWLHNGARPASPPITYFSS